MNTNIQIQNAGTDRTMDGAAASGRLAVKLGLLAAMWVVPGFSQLGETPNLQPCLAAAADILSNSPNHGSGQVKCGKAKRFYGSEKKVHAVTGRDSIGQEVQGCAREEREDGG